MELIKILKWVKKLRISQIEDEQTSNKSHGLTIKNWAKNIKVVLRCHSFYHDNVWTHEVLVEFTNGLYGLIVNSVIELYDDYLPHYYDLRDCFNVRQYKFSDTEDTWSDFEDPLSFKA